MLEVTGLRVAYGGIQAVRGITFHVNQGEMVALIGANGAGKTSTLKALSRLLNAAGGSVRYCGKEISTLQPHELVTEGIALVPEGRGVFPRLKERSHQLAGTLSGGEQQMLAIGRALMSRPKLLLLDEPSMGLAPLMVQKIFEVVRTVADEGMTVLLVEQNAKLALEVSQRGYVMESGEITLTDDSSNLLASPKVREAYLGE